MTGNEGVSVTANRVTLDEVKGAIKTAVKVRQDRGELIEKIREELNDE